MIAWLALLACDGGGGPGGRADREDTDVVAGDDDDGVDPAGGGAPSGLEADDAGASLDPIPLLDAHGPGDLDGDGLGDVLVSTRTWDSRGAVLLFRHGLPADARPSDADLVVTGEIGQQIGWYLGGGGDLDGDGTGDLVFSEYPWGEDLWHPTVWLVSGAANGAVSISDAVAIEGGTGAVAVGDVDGDGQADLLSAHPGAGITGESFGAAYVYRGPITGDVGYEDVAHVILGAEESQDTGRGALLADVDGDGADEALIGACDYMDYGFVSVVSLGDARTVWVDAGYRLQGARCSVEEAPVAAGDLDQDGHTDIVVGQVPGAVIVHGPITGDVELWSEPDRIDHDDPYSFYGGGLAAPGDVDGDGHPDLALGGVEAYAPEQGDGWIAYGPFEGARRLRAADDIRRIAGDGREHRFGIVAESVGDADGDGLPDVLFGASGNARSERGGGIYLFGGAR